MYEVERVVVGPLETNCYLICKGSECLVVDPGAEPERIAERLAGRGVAAIVATHLHFDHVGAVEALAERFRAPFIAHRADWELREVFARVAESWGFEAPRLPEPSPAGAELPLGLRALHVPGHTPGSIAVLGDGFVLTGDLLFRGSVGRTDLPGGDWETLVRSVCSLYELPPSYAVLPGHGPPTTLGREARANYFVPQSTCKKY
ncbi:MBL fold metallo-hydrolase [Thermoproteus tenax]|uniref:MBL fold metallo-hydrolase n=1 Tax=Thermoproteus tenax TaxID=2271 RepID=UPI00069C2324|nr:MBL fold metallo-hydrolase [Thermoproteus tenax]